ncbi:DUF1127 domain-containing protein [Mesorhizobium sp. ISC25]|uniref:DUF1127 domain-containing protein n=1 Tax=Mesorhizobium sp. ISC25 TaxID=3077335 RepID=UPI0035E2FDB6
MAHTETRAARSMSKRLLGSSLKGAAMMIAAFTGWRRTIARRRALADLTTDQLNDIGHSESHQPALDAATAVLITNLMSMR